MNELPPNPIYRLISSLPPRDKDEFVGNAVQDSVAGQFYPGANWILKGENTAVHGYLKLEMR
jgi:hypothetical protein